MKICHSKDPNYPGCGRSDVKFYDKQSLCAKCYNKRTYKRRLEKRGQSNQARQYIKIPNKKQLAYKEQEREKALFFNQIITRPL